MNANPRQLLWRIRILLGIMIAGLIVSGITAFPLLHEIDLLHGWLAAAFVPAGVAVWIGKVHEGLHAMHRAYPFLAYGTDWLAFGHLVIAIFFIGPFIDPVRNFWVVRAGQIACLLVIPLALIAGAMREIPFWWRLIDSAFGVVGLVPLCLAARLIRRLEDSRRG